MLTQIEAEVDINGVVHLLEPIKITRKSRAIVTVLDSEPVMKREASDEEAKFAEERFARWIGSANSGDSTSADNEKIDADLAKEYGTGLND